MVAEVPSISGLLQCLPWQLQELLSLPPAAMPGSWSEYTFGIGGAGSGAPFHAHEAAINVVVTGTKRWFLYPPAQAEYTTKPIFEWLRDDYPHLAPESRPIEMIQRAGDVVILPALWGHATVVGVVVFAYPRALHVNDAPTCRKPNTCLNRVCVCVCVYLCPCLRLCLRALVLACCPTRPSATASACPRCCTTGLRTSAATCPSAR